jgi:capsule polysaccharide export protein KpsC/LpsZ
LNTYDLMRESELGITLCSQAGLEMLSMGKPVLTAGRAFYSGKGLTYDVPTRGAYPAVLEEALDNPCLSDEQRAGIEKLLYHMLFEYLVPFDRERLCVTPEAADALVSRGAFHGLAIARQPAVPALA